MKDLSYERARELFDYCPETGQLSWKVLIQNRRNPIATLSHYGYVVVGVDGRQHKAHRIVWVLHNGSITDDPIDHVNGFKSDNRIENLRSCASKENSRNRNPKTNSRLGILGIRQQSKRRCFEARISVNGRSVYLGTFPTIEAAEAAHRVASEKYHGEFSAYNRGFA